MTNAQATATPNSNPADDLARASPDAALMDVVLGRKLATNDIRTAALKELARRGKTLEDLARYEAGTTNTGPRAVTAADLDRWVAQAQSMVDDHYTRFPRQGSRLSIMRGRKYARIVSTHTMDGQPSSGRSVYCFIDMTNGNVLKAATWKAPAKHARGNIFAADPLAGVTEYGGRYMR